MAPGVFLPSPMQPQRPLPALGFGYYRHLERTAVGLFFPFAKGWHGVFTLDLLVARVLATGQRSPRTRRSLQPADSRHKSAPTQLGLITER